VLREARTVLSLLRRFPGYTLGTLMAEDAGLLRLLRLLRIEELGTPEGGA
jgi:hypothetical protein